MGYLPLRVEVATRDVMAVLHLHKAHPQVCADVERRMCQLIREVYEEKVDLRTELEESATCVCKALVEDIVEKTINDAIPQAEAEAVLREQAALLQTVSELRTELSVKDKKIRSIIAYLQNIQRAHNYMLHSYFREVFMLRIKIDELEHREPAKNKYQSFAMTVHRVPSNRILTNKSDEFNISNTCYVDDEPVDNNKTLNEGNSDKLTACQKENNVAVHNNRSSVHNDNSFVAYAERTMEYDEHINIDADEGNEKVKYDNNEDNIEEDSNHNTVNNTEDTEIDTTNGSTSNNTMHVSSLGHVLLQYTENPLSATNNTCVDAAAHTTSSSSGNNDTGTKNSINNDVTRMSGVQTALPPPLYKDANSVSTTNTCVSIHDRSTDSSLEVCDRQQNNQNASRNKEKYEKSSKMVDVQSKIINDDDDDNDDEKEGKNIKENVYAKSNGLVNNLCEHNDSSVKSCKDSCSELESTSSLALYSSTVTTKSATAVVSRSKCKAEAREANCATNNSRVTYLSNRNALPINATNSVVSGRSVDAIFDYEKYVAMLHGKNVKLTSSVLQSPCYALHAESTTEEWTGNLFGDDNITSNELDDD